MGLSPSAELIWGIPVVAYDDEGEPTQFWDEENDDWIKLPGNLKIEMYGHYEDPDGLRGILTTTRIKRYWGDCWDPKRIPGRLTNPYEDIMAATEQAKAAGLDVNFLEADWWLVASYG